MGNLALVGISFVIGIVLRRTEKLPADTAGVLSAFIIYVSLPALVLLHIHRLELDRSLVLAAFMPWLLFLTLLIAFQIVPGLRHIDPGSKGALLLTAGLGNTSFVGLPMIEAFYGPEFLGIGIVADQGGTFLALSTLGLLVLTKYGNAAGSQSPIKRVLEFPPFQALVLAIFLRPLPFPEWFVFVLKSLGNTLTPLALITVGFRMNIKDLGSSTQLLAGGLIYKLILSPLLIAILYYFILPVHDSVYQISVLEAAMPPMITGGILAMEYGLNPRLSSLILGIGIPLSFLTVPSVWWLINLL